MQGRAKRQTVRRSVPSTPAVPAALLFPPGRPLLLAATFGWSSRSNSPHIRRVASPADNPRASSHDSRRTSGSGSDSNAGSRTAMSSGIARIASSAPVRRPTSSGAGERQQDFDAFDCRLRARPVKITSRTRTSLSPARAAPATVAPRAWRASARAARQRSCASPWRSAKRSVSRSGGATGAAGSAFFRIRGMSWHHLLRRARNLRQRHDPIGPGQPHQLSRQEIEDLRGLRFLVCSAMPSGLAARPGIPGAVSSQPHKRIDAPSALAGCSMASAHRVIRAGCQQAGGSR